MRVRPALLALVVSFGVAGRSMGPPPTPETVPATGTIVGTVYVAGSQIPLPYAVVSIDALGKERFADGGGRFTIADVPAGKLTIRAKHIGYSPVDLPVTVPSGDTVRVRFDMVKLVVELPPVTAVGACSKPGPPKKDANPALFLLFEQLQQNAERYRLLTRSYPFRYTVLRTKTRQSAADPNTPPDTMSIDSLTGESTRDWRYKPGNVVVFQRTGNGIGQVMMLPELGDFADDEFLKNHCFGYAGVEVINSEPLIRFDFAPADKIKEPDIAGVVYLDSASFQIRRAQINLTKPTTNILTQGSGVSVLSYYSELAPGIPIMSSYLSVNTMSSAMQQMGWASTTLDQRVIPESVIWLKGKP